MSEIFLLYLRLPQYNIFTQYDFFHKNPNPTRSGFGQGVFLFVIEQSEIYNHLFFTGDWTDYYIFC